MAEDVALHGGLRDRRHDHTSFSNTTSAPSQVSTAQSIVGWSHSDESFMLSSGSQEWWTRVSKQKETPALLPVLEGRLFLASMKGTPVAQPAEYYVTLNKKLR